MAISQLSGHGAVSGLVLEDGFKRKKSFRLRASSNSELLSCFFTACNAIKFMNIRGSSSAESQKQTPRTKWDARQFLVAGEGICLSAAVASHVFFLQKQQQQQHQQQTVVQPCEVPRQKIDIGPGTWQLVPLWLAVLFNIIYRAAQPEISCAENYDDPRLLRRVENMEQDVGSTVAIIRALTKQVEKISVRVQATRRTVQDPIKKISNFAEDTSEAIKVLAAREDMVEREIKQLRQELFCLQEHQMKQLELIARLVEKTKDLEYGNAASNHALKQHAGAPKIEIKDDYKYDFWLSNDHERDHVYAES